MEDDMTLELIIDNWLKFKKIVLKESTYYRYIYMINQYIIPYFKNAKMKDLEKYDFNLFVIELMNNLKPTSIKNVISLLKSILYYSTKKYGYHFDFDFVVIPKIYKKELRVLTPREKNKLEKYCLKNNTFV